METKTLPKSVQEFIHQYETLNFYSREICTPYYINIKRVRSGLSVLVGKGTPEELVEETLIYARLRNFDLRNSTKNEIRDFMKSQGLGIDCSGFVSQIYDFWLKDKFYSALSRRIHFPKASFARRLARRLRPIQNISADLLTGSLNSDPIKLKDILPGDLIRTKGVKRGDHILMISKVIYDENGVVSAFEYVNSNQRYGAENGIRFGIVNVTNVNAELKNQDWTELDENGINWTLQGLLNNYEDNGLRRPNFIDIEKE